ncbi:MAG: chromate efflux transporter [Streptosporangiaceae bacterium]
MPSPRSKPSTARLFVSFLVIGVSGFGIAIMQAVRAAPVRRGWMTRDEVDEAFGLVQLYPGAMLADLVTYIGYRMRGVRGALAAVAGFLLPSLVLMWLLSWAFFTFGTHPEVRDLVVGLDALVVGVLVHLVVDFGAQHAREKIFAVIALGTFALALAGQNVLWGVLGGFLVGAIVPRRSTAMPAAAQSGVKGWRPGRRLWWAVLPGIAVIAGAVVAALAPGSLAAVSADMTKIGAVAFGNGTAILPILRQDALAHHWLTNSQFAAGVAFGQITPGPILTTAAFIGYAAAGWWGAVAGGLAIFVPSIAMTMVVAEIYPWLRRVPFIHGAIAGVMAAFTGLLASLVIVLGRPALAVPAALVLAAGAFVAIRVFKWPLILVFAAGLAVWGLYLAAGGTA